MITQKLPKIYFITNQPETSTPNTHPHYSFRPIFEIPPHQQSHHLPTIQSTTQLHVTCKLRTVIKNSKPLKKQTFQENSFDFPYLLALTLDTSTGKT